MYLLFITCVCRGFESHFLYLYFSSVRAGDAMNSYGVFLGTINSLVARGEMPRRPLLFKTP